MVSYWALIFIFSLMYVWLYNICSLKCVRQHDARHCIAIYFFSWIFAFLFFPINFPVIFALLNFVHNVFFVDFFLNSFNCCCCSRCIGVVDNHMNKTKFDFSARITKAMYSVLRLWFRSPHWRLWSVHLLLISLFSSRFSASTLFDWIQQRWR